MEDTIEICSGCGKIPRIMDRSSGFFICSRCNNRSTIYVKTDEYEKTVTELDRQFHENLLRKKHDEIKSEPIVLEPAPKKPSLKKAAKRKPLLKKPAKSAKPKASKKAKKIAVGKKRR